MGIPGDLPAVGKANISYSVPKNGYQWSVRGDYYIKQSDRLYVTAIRTYVTSVGTSPRSTLNNDQANSSDFANANWTHTFSPRLLNEAAVNIIRPYGADLAVDTMAIPFINVVGLQNFSVWGPGNFTQQTLGWHDVMTATVKNHTLKFGFDQFNIRENDQQRGAYDRRRSRLLLRRDRMEREFESSDFVELVRSRSGIVQFHDQIASQASFCTSRI